MYEFKIGPKYKGEIECVIIKEFNPRECCEEYSIVTKTQDTSLDEMLGEISRNTNHFCPIGKLTGISEEAYKIIKKEVIKINRNIEESETKKRELPDILIK